MHDESEGMTGVLVPTSKYLHRSETKMLQRLRNRAQGQEGFTLIELLVVILIIGILAAVAIPAFLNQKGKANDANVKTDINTAQTALETFYTDNQTYVGATPAALVSIEPTLSNATATGTGKEALSLGSLSTSGYAITATDPNGLTFTLTKASDGTLTRSCTLPANQNPAGCKGLSQSSVAQTGGNW